MIVKTEEVFLFLNLRGRFWLNLETVLRHKFYYILTFLFEQRFDIDAIAPLDAKVVKPTQIVCNEVQVVTTLAPNNNYSALVASLAESAGLLRVADAASIHNHHHTAGLVISVLNARNVVQVKVVAHFEHQVLDCFVVGDLFILIGLCDGRSGEHSDLRRE